ncbi:MAG: lysoplasmalogenase [Promethearchaeota archaeon]
MLIHIVIIVLLIGITLINVAGNYKQNRIMIWLSKPLLAPIIMLFYVLGNANTNWFIILGLGFGFLGDLLLLNKNNEKAFMAGLASFLLGHLSYILAFINDIEFTSIDITIMFSILVYLITGWLIINYLKINLGKFKIPTIFYMIIIELMSFFSLCRAVKSNNELAWLTFIGSVLFIASDAILASIKFKNFNEKYHSLVMLTYVLAQLLITTGFLSASTF